MRVSVAVENEGVSFEIVYLLRDILFYMDASKNNSQNYF